MAEKGRSTQRIANAFPSWANVRTDEQSLGFQFLNSLGKRFDDLRKQQSHIGDNYYLSTSVVGDIDVYYRHKLPGTWEFTKEDNDDTEFLYTPPTVSGIHDEIIEEVVIASGNNIETFWYTPIPDRISLETVASGEHVLVSGMFSGVLFSPPAELSGVLAFPNRLSVTVMSGTNFVGLDDNNNVRKTMIQLEGLTREGGEVTEEIVFLHAETQQSLHEFKYIDNNGIRAFGALDAGTTTLIVKSADFRADSYPVEYELDTNKYREDMPLFWAIGSGVNTSQATLDLKKYDSDDLELRMQGFTAQHTIMQQELLDTNDLTITPVDLAPEPHSDRLWVVTSGMLYLYSARMPYPDLGQLNGKDYDAASVIEPSSYTAVYGEEIEFDYVWWRPVTGFVAHRVWVEKPDGTKKSLEDGAEVTYHTDSTSWFYGEPRKRIIRPTESYVLDQYGDWLFCLEVSYTDGTTSIDKRIVSVLKQRALGEYNLTELGLNVPMAGVTFDSEEKLWVLDTDGGQYQIDRHYDVMIIDFKKKIIYFREPYDQIRVYEV